MNERLMQEMELKMLTDMDRICREHGLSYSLAYGSVLGAVRHKGFIPWDLDIDIMVGIAEYETFCRVLREQLPPEYVLYSYRTDPAYEFLFSRIGLLHGRHDDLYLDIFPMVGWPGSPTLQRVFAKLAYGIYRGYFLKKIDAKVNYSHDPRKRRIATVAKCLLALVPPRLFSFLYEKLQLAFPLEKSVYVYNFCGIYGTKEIMPKGYLTDLMELEFEGQLFPVPRDWDSYLTHIYGDYMTPRKTNYI